MLETDLRMTDGLRCLEYSDDLLLTAIRRIVYYLTGDCTN